jgi:hypothetical protein
MTPAELHSAVARAIQESLSRSDKAVGSLDEAMEASTAAISLVVAECARVASYKFDVWHRASEVAISNDAKDLCLARAIVCMGIANAIESLNPERHDMSQPKLTKEQAAIIGAFTGILSGQFADMHEYIERIMGRPVWTHEMGSREFMDKVRAAAKADFLAICAEGART